MDINVEKQGNEIIKALYSSRSEWRDFKGIIDKIRERGVTDYTADELSNMCINLAVLLSTLEGMAANAVSLCNEKYLYRKHRYFKEFYAFTGGVTAADKSAEQATIEDKQNEAIHQYVADVLKGQVKVGYQLISTIQSRLGLIKHDLVANT